MQTRLGPTVAKLFQILSKIYEKQKIEKRRIYFSERKLRYLYIYYKILYWYLKNDYEIFMKHSVIQNTKLIFLFVSGLATTINTFVFIA